MAIEFSSDLLSAIVSFTITVFILSYLIGDNPLYRAAIYIFVGVASGYAAAVAWNQVIFPQLFQPIWSLAVFSGRWQDLMLIFPLIGSTLLLTKISPRLSGFGKIPVAFLVGVGAAVTIGGAVLGTLLPQIGATVGVFDVKLAGANNFDLLFILFNGGWILLGVVGTLAYFHFGARQNADGSPRSNFLLSILGSVGRFYIAVTFGVLFAGVYLSALTALIERMEFFRNFIAQIMQLL